MSKNTLKDRNFDDLSDRFKQRVYGSLKGDLRLKLLREDLMPIVSGARLKVLDAGGGQGQMAAWLAELGHQVTVVDLSQNMLDELSTHTDKPVTTVCSSIQDFLANNTQQFDLIICHAVLEWLVEPEAMVELLVSTLAPKGYLSLVFFNKNSLIMSQAILANWDRLYEVQSGAKASKGLTPQNPIDPQDCLNWWNDQDLSMDLKRGIRVFHDYVRPDEAHRLSFEEAINIERIWGTKEPWWQLARYIHFLGTKRV